jgi:hypothetical protein
MSDSARLVRAWRQRRKDKGLKSVLIWLTPEEKHCLELQAVQHQEDFGRVLGRLLRRAHANGMAVPKPAPAPAARKPVAAKRAGASKAKALSPPASHREIVERVAEAHAQYPTLSKNKFARLLFERNIYRAKDRKTKEEKPVDSSRLNRWLVEAHEEGLL